MEVVTAKTVRFTELVKECGRAHAVTLWGNPEKDPEVKQAIRQNRVLTIPQSNVGSKTDFGIVGFHPDKNRSFLVFPKSLARFADRRVIGIKYDLIETPAPEDPAPTARVSKKQKAQPKSRKEPKPVEQPRFKVVVETVAVTELVLEVAASGKKVAESEALKLARKNPVSLNNADVSYRVRSSNKLNKP